MDQKAAGPGSNLPTAAEPLGQKDSLSENFNDLFAKADSAQLPKKEISNSENRAGNSPDIKPTPSSNQAITTLFCLSAFGMGVSFFMPWLKMFRISGFDLTKMDKGTALWWAVPVVGLIGVAAGVSQKGRMAAGLAGVGTVIVGISYGMKHLKNEFWGSLEPGAFIGIISGISLLILALADRFGKKTN